MRKKLIICRYLSKGSLDSAVGIATGYGLDGRGVGVRVLVEVRFVSSSRRPDPCLIGGSFPGGKGSGT
jgi:hypothetical protein